MEIPWDAVITRKCDNCGKEYYARVHDLRRGWGKCCSKSCAAKKRSTKKRNTSVAKTDEQLLDLLSNDQAWRTKVESLEQENQRLREVCESLANVVYKSMFDCEDRKFDQQTIWDKWYWEGKDALDEWEKMKEEGR